MKAYAGIDLHSSNNFIGISDENDKKLYAKRHGNRLKDVLRALEPFKEALQGVVVESTYNWYWLVDGNIGDVLYFITSKNLSAPVYSH